MSGIPARRIAAVTALLVTGLLVLAQTAVAMPAFAREYGVSCNVCHAAYPRLNDFGNRFARDMNFRMANWRDHTVPAGDEMLALPKTLPLAARVQTYVQARDAESIDPVTGEITADSSLDFQAPYLLKLLSSAPLTDNISYYFYMIFAEKGANTEVIVEDAWFTYDDLFDSGVGLLIGQFQLSDLMFPREIRMTFQDFMAYRFAGITYDRGIYFGRGFGPLDVSLGFVNGNGIEENFNVTSPGYRRPDHLFDNDTGKSVFGRIGTDIGPASIGLFGLSGEQRNATGPAGTEPGDRDTDKVVLGLDASGRLAERWYWFGQYLWSSWDGFLDPAIDYQWTAGFAGVDYVLSDRWVFSALVNVGDAGDLAGTDTVYEGIEMQTLTLGMSYYFMRNVKGVLELNVDFLAEEPQSGVYYTGHLSKENYFLVGIDAAF